MKKKFSKDRNYVALALIKRARAGSGSHGKSEKAIRRNAKIKLVSSEELKDIFNKHLINDFK